MKKYLISIFAMSMAVCSLALTGCSSGDDETGDGTGGGGTTSCDYCYKKEPLNSFLVINGVRYHTGTSSTQYLGTERGSYMDTQLHRDNGAAALTDWYDVVVNLSKQSGSSIDNVTVGQKLLLENGTDKVHAWFQTGVGEYTRYETYVSGSISCTAKSGTLTTLTFTDVVLKNKSDNTSITVNGSLVYEEYK